MSMIDVRRTNDLPPMLVVGIGHATEDELIREGLEVFEADLHVLAVARAAGDIAVSAAIQSE